MILALVSVYVLVAAVLGLVATALLAHAHGTTFRALTVYLWVLLWPVTLPATLLYGWAASLVDRIRMR